MAQRITVDYTNSDYRGHSTVVRDDEAEVTIAKTVRHAVTQPNHPWQIREWSATSAVLTRTLDGRTMTMTTYAQPLA